MLKLVTHTYFIRLYYIGRFLSNKNQKVNQDNYVGLYVNNQ